MHSSQVLGRPCQPAHSLPIKRQRYRRSVVPAIQDDAVQASSMQGSDALHSQAAAALKAWVVQHSPEGLPTQLSPRPVMDRG